MIRLLRFHPAWGMRWWIGVVVVGTSASAAYDVTMRGATVWQPNVVAVTVIGYLSVAANIALHQALTSQRTGTFWRSLPLSTASLRRFQLFGFAHALTVGSLALPAAMITAALLGAEVPIVAVWRWLVLLEVGLLWIVVLHNRDEPDAGRTSLLAAMAIVGAFVAYRLASPTSAAILAAAIVIAIIHWAKEVEVATAGASWQPIPTSRPEWAPDEDGWGLPDHPRGVFTMAPAVRAPADPTRNGRWLLHRLCWREVSRPDHVALIWPFLLCVGGLWTVLQFGPGRYAGSLASLFFLFTPIRWSLAHTDRVAALPIAARRLFAYAVLPHLGWLALGTLPTLLWLVRTDSSDVVFGRTGAGSIWILVVMVVALLVQMTGRGALAPLTSSWRSTIKWVWVSPFPLLVIWIAVAVLVPPLPQSDGTSLSVDAVLINRAVDLLPAQRVAAFAVVLATAVAGYVWAERRFARNGEAVKYAFDAAAPDTRGT